MKSAGATRTAFGHWMSIVNSLRANYGGWLLKPQKNMTPDRSGPEALLEHCRHSLLEQVAGLCVLLQDGSIAFSQERLQLARSMDCSALAWLAVA